MIEYYDVTVRVRYAETDQMGVVYHSNFLIWFEVGEWRSCVRWVSTTSAWKRRTIATCVVADAHCRYHHPARYDEVITVRTRILEANNRMLKFGYEVFREQADKNLLADGGNHSHRPAHRDGRVTHFPEKYKTAFLAIAASLPDRSECMSHCTDRQ